MKRNFAFAFIVTALICSKRAGAQMFADSVRKEWKVYEQSSKNDTARFILYSKLSNSYRRNNYDSCLYYARFALEIAKKLKSRKAEASALAYLEFGLRETGDFVGALNTQFQGLQLARETGDEDLEANGLNSIGNTYLELGDAAKAIEYYRSSSAKFKKVGNTYWFKNELSNIGNAFEVMARPDSALLWERPLHADSTFPADLVPELLLRMGNTYKKLGREAEAMKLYKQGVVSSFPTQTVSDRAKLYCQIAKLYEKQNELDSCIHYGLEAYRTAKSISFRTTVLEAALLLAKMYYKASDVDQAYAYQQVALNYNDTLFGAEKFRQIQLIFSVEQERQQKVLEKAAVQKRQYWMIGAVVIFILVVLFFTYRNFAQKRSYTLLQKQRNKIASQKDKLEETLTALNSTQAQLIQSEKMASLGELTAGIAHEIQNPLNFVNNFSEVSTELVDEMEEALEQDDKEEAVAIASDIKENLRKIHHHGKRADAIVKGMLQHSRANTGKKELTDINALADEYLRLAYHGLRAKDKGFHADFRTEFAKNIGMLELVPQDVGRVLLNLFNNAFYAVNEKKRQLDGAFEPAVTVTTKRVGDKIEISVKDNGNGIPRKVVDKIFQPFFTTKPTGQGTGLGLSLSYDIIKSHGGEIKVNSKEEEGTEFTIQFPI